MPEEVLFKSESDQSRDEIASFLHTVAENLSDGADITLTSGDSSVTMDPPTRPTFEVKAEREGPQDGPYELSVEFELEWDERDGSADNNDEPLQIE
ncbi:amphi-Trp domain-containing protein [Halovenus salina]|uniref:Amphi-Trp domain-containing protein n=1 Tax=Halovenus salina TaxID=1510225 RepID=A0ABD5VYN8_9EURY|nr:amphi-Trp domain-containing protein [Halovenus salina]